MLDKILSIVESLPEKQFRTVVVVALAALLGAAGYSTLSLVRIQARLDYFHGDAGR